MEPQTSFIPKKSLTKEPVRSAPMGLLTLLAVLFFFLSFLSGAGVYFFKIILERNIESAKLSLERVEKAFEPALIVELERLDKRIESAKKLLDKHVVISPIFEVLEDVTIPNVRYTKFSYSIAGSGNIALLMSGQAKSYAYVAVQSDVLGESKFVNNHIFSNLNLDSVGNVIFDLTASVDPSLVLYKDALVRQSEVGGGESETE